MSVDRLEKLGRIRLSDSFFLRDFLHSEISQAYAIPNVPHDVELAVAAGSMLCRELLEPIQQQYAPPKGTLTAPAMSNSHGDHRELYRGLVGWMRAKGNARD